MEWPGLAEETTQICEKLKIEDCNIKGPTKLITKKLLQKLVTEGMKWNYYSLRTNNYGKKECINKKLISEARKWYISRFKTLSFAGNFSKDKKFVKWDWMYRCGEKEKETHLTSSSCPMYSCIREKLYQLWGWPGPGLLLPEGPGNEGLDW